MQQPNPNDPYYLSPAEQPQPGIPYQPVPPAYQAQPAPPSYYSQPGEPSYYSQPAEQYSAPAEQYAAAPPQAVESQTQQKAQARKYGVAKFMDYLQWLLLCLELLLLTQFILKLLGADPNNPFAAFVYSLAGFFLYPFAGIVPTTKYGTHGNAAIVWSTLIAMAVYALVFYLVKLLLHTTISRPQEPIE